jgi:hypothetical protein
MIIPIDAKIVIDIMTAAVVVANAVIAIQNRVSEIIDINPDQETEIIDSKNKVIMVTVIKGKAIEAIDIKIKANEKIAIKIGDSMMVRIDENNRISTHKINVRTEMKAMNVMRAWWSIPTTLNSSLAKEGANFVLSKVLVV